MRLKKVSPLAACMFVASAAAADGFIASSGLQACVRVQAVHGRPQLQVLSLPTGGWDNHAKLV